MTNALGSSSAQPRLRVIAGTAGCLLAILGLGAPGLAAEVQLHEVYTATGSLGIQHHGLGLVGSGGTGTLSDVAVPGNVAKAYLYWMGYNTPQSATGQDPTITFTRSGSAGVGVNADTTTVVQFEKPLSPGTYFWDANHMSFVADVTQYVLPGTHDYTLSDFDMGASGGEMGFGLQIVYEDQVVAAGPGGGPANEVSIYQGHDFAYAGSDWPNSGELARTHVLNHTFEPAGMDRLVDAAFFLGDGELADRPDTLYWATGTHQNPGDLPTELITSGIGTLLDPNPLGASDGPEWDTVEKTVMIPAGATYVSIQFGSGGGTGQGTPEESFSWLSASFNIIPEPTAVLLLGLGGLAIIPRRKR